MKLLEVYLYLFSLGLVRGQTITLNAGPLAAVDFDGTDPGTANSDLDIEPDPVASGRVSEVPVRICPARN